MTVKSIRIKAKVLSAFLAILIAAGSASAALCCNHRYEKSQPVFDDTVSEKLDALVNTSYTKMLSAGKDRQLVKNLAETALTDLKDIKSAYDQNTEEVNKVAKEIGSDEINGRINQYAEKIESSFNDAQAAFEKLAANDESTKQDVKALLKLVSDKENITSNASGEKYYPENSVNKKPVIDSVSAMKPASQAAAMSLDDVSAGAAYTALSGDVRIDDAIKAKADELKTPLAVYQYVKNNISFEAYYGSRKGAAGTYYEKAGNDTDTASLLIGMLRYLGYSAKYANGTVRLTGRQVMSITGADNVTSGAQILANLMKDVKLFSSNGVIAYVEMNRTWVEVNVPYTDYRGAGDAAGDNRWIPLDASFKSVELQFQKGDELAIQEADKETSFLSSDEYAVPNEDHEKAREVLAELPDFLSLVDSKYGKEAPTELNAYYTTIKQETFDYLPLSLEYTVLDEKTSETDTNLVASDTVSISVGASLNCTLRAADVYNTSIALVYLPATESDRALIERYGDIRKVPAYLLSLVPAVTVDNEVVAKAKDWYAEVTAGTEQSMLLTLRSSEETLRDSDTVFAGSVYSLVLHYGIISEKELSTAYESAKQQNLHSTQMNPYSSEILGSYLDFAGKYYYSMTDVSTSYLSYYKNVNVSRLLGLSILSYSLTTNTTFGYISSLSPGGFTIDAEFNSVAVVDRFQENHNARAFTAVAGYYESQYEAELWTWFWQQNSISTTEILSKAATEHVPLHYISSLNKDEVSQLAIKSDTKNEINQYVSRGYTVIVPESEVQFGQWTGTGYTALHLDTGSAAYKIDGGYNGGSTPTKIDLTSADTYAKLVNPEYLDSYVYASIEICIQMHNFYSVWNHYQLLNAIKVAEACPILSWGLFDTVCSMYYDIEYFYGMLVEIPDYFAHNDEAAGRNIVKYALSYLQCFYMDFILKTPLESLLDAGQLDFVSAMDNLYYLLHQENEYAPHLRLKAAAALVYAFDTLSAVAFIKYPPR